MPRDPDYKFQIGEEVYHWPVGDHQGYPAKMEPILAVVTWLSGVNQKRIQVRDIPAPGLIYDLHKSEEMAEIMSHVAANLIRRDSNE